MVRITEEEITDFDGRVRKRRTIEAAHARLESPDGTVEEYSDVNAKEWPWTPEGNPPEWRVFGIPMHEVLQRGHSLATSTLTFLSGNGDVILRIGSITIGMQLSFDGGDSLIGKEVPLDNRGCDCANKTGLYPSEGPNNSC